MDPRSVKTLDMSSNESSSFKMSTSFSTQSKSGFVSVPYEQEGESLKRVSGLEAVVSGKIRLLLEVFVDDVLEDTRTESAILPIAVATGTGSDVGLAGERLG